MALAPHQLGQVIGQRQLEVSAATKRRTDAEEKYKTRAADFDKYVTTVEEDFAHTLKALTDAHQAAADGFIAERASLVADHEADVAAAQQAMDTANTMLAQAVEAQKTQLATAPFISTQTQLAPNLTPAA